MLSDNVTTRQDRNWDLFSGGVGEEAARPEGPRRELGSWAGAVI